MTHSQAVWLTVDEVAERLNMNRRTVLARCLEWDRGDKSGLRSTNFGGTKPRGKRRQITEDDLDSWLQSRTTSA